MVVFNLISFVYAGKKRWLFPDRPSIDQKWSKWIQSKIMNKGKIKIFQPTANKNKIQMFFIIQYGKEV